MKRGGSSHDKRISQTAWLVSLAAISVLLVLATWLVFTANRDYYYEVVLLVVCITALVLLGAAVMAFSGIRIGERERLERSRQREAFERERILTIVNNLADSVYSTDPQGHIRIYNAAGLNLLDTNENINGRHIDDIFQLHDKEGKKVKLYHLMKQTKAVTYNDDLSLTFGDDDMRLSLIYAPIKASFSARNKTGTEDGYIVIARDITKLKTLEEERDEFISVVSHELRTPITVAEGTISNLQLMVERSIEDKKKLAEGLNGAHDQVMFLANMINDLSTLSRAERGIAGEVEEIDVSEMAHDLHNEYAPEAEQQGLQLDLELSPGLGTVHTSRLYLHELLQNFITNAIKYTKDGSVTLKIRKQSEGLVFAVSDTGIGISKSDQAKVFGKFYRSEDYRTRETGGTGLGLYVAAKLAKKMNTTIELTSRLNHGSTFSFRLPSSKTDTIR